MPRIPRKFVFDPTEVGVYHCINRCVRRAFLCGTDSLTGKCFDHRKEWIQQRMEFLAGNLAVDVLGFSIMSNHIHVVVRNRPDIVAGWSDDDVARRWWNVFPKRKDRDGHPAEPTDAELTMITADPERLAKVRTRLSSLSWFMRCLVEPIARRANREDKCSGHFFEGRFRCQPILDEAALVACLAYVDLNPIRAGIAETPETSRFTSVFERIQALCEMNGRSQAGLLPAGPQAAIADDPAAITAEPGAPKSTTQNRPPASAEWLSPFELSSAAVNEPVPTHRASNKGCLSMSFAEYLQLLDWTGRQIREDKSGAIPSDLAPVLERLKLSDEGWLNLVHDFRRKFRRAAGTPESLAKEAQKRGCQKMHGIVHSRLVFDPPRSSTA
jgi:REP element-mobilizing transposase RayT